jgi:hypothetical protein
MGQDGQAEERVGEYFHLLIWFGFIFGGTEVLIQGFAFSRQILLPLEPLCQSFFGLFFSR